MNIKTSQCLRIIPLMINLSLVIIHLGILLWLSFNHTFGQIGFKIQFFYYSYSVFIVIFIILNSLSVFLIKIKNATKYITLLIGLLGIIFYTLFNNDLNPF